MRWGEGPTHGGFHRRGFPLRGTSAGSQQSRPFSSVELTKSRMADRRASNEQRSGRLARGLSAARPVESHAVPEALLGPAPFARPFADDRSGKVIHAKVRLHDSSAKTLVLSTDIREGLSPNSCWRGRYGVESCGWSRISEWEWVGLQVEYTGGVSRSGFELAVGKCRCDKGLSSISGARTVLRAVNWQVRSQGAST